MLFKLIRIYKYILVIAFTFANFSFLPTHKYYFSLSEIKANTLKKTITVSTKLFIDDLEFTLQKEGNLKYDLSNSTENKTVQKALFDYVNKHLQIILNGKIVSLSFVGFETDNDVIWIYLDSKLNYKEFKGVKIINSILYNFSTDQTNLIQFKWNNLNFTEKLIYPNKEVIIY
jgi:hypothetical protein